MNKKISFLSLTILIISAIDNVKNMPAAALLGSSLIFFFVLSALFFLIPTSLMSAELAAAFPEKGGIYHWIHRAFGSRFAFCAVWLQWINTMVWYPTILSFIAGAGAYLIAPELAENKIFLISSILIIFWGLTLFNLKGIHASARITNICAVIGTFIPMLLLILLGCVWVFSGKPVQVHLQWSSLIPSFSNVENWVSLIAVMASFLGMELSAVHVNDVDKPQTNYKKAVLLAAVFIVFTMTLSSLSIALVLPAKEINLIAGVMQVFKSFFEQFGLNALMPFVAVSIAIGSMGTMVNWLISPAKGLLQAAEYGFLPSFFSKKNQAGVAYNILIAQAVLVSVFCCIVFLLPGVNGFFWFLTALSTELYMCMYIILFCAGLKLHYALPDRPSSFKIPGKSLGIWTTALFGLCGCLATIIISFFPPTNIDVGHPLTYLLMIIFGNLLAIGPVFIFIRIKEKRELIDLLG